MPRRTLYTCIKRNARHGHTQIFLKLYPKKEQQLLSEGFSVRRMRAIGGLRQPLCLVEWADAIEGTVAYEYLELAKSNRPQQAEEDASDPIPPPYSGDDNY